ncbi:MAG: ABC transporter ATP-binding protein [Acetivibrio ethanolgignens]
MEEKIKKEIIATGQKYNVGLLLDNISFHYSDRKKTLCNISFFIEKGKMLAIVGESGSGKSTVFSLIERFYEQDEGSIYYEGIDIRNIPLINWRKKIAYVQQESPIMSGTVLDNLTYGLDSYNEKSVLSAIERAELNQFINSLPNGYNTEVGEQGVKLSGGQKQRIAIARAMIRDPQILLLDEATANLDSCTEKKVQRALERLMIGRITIIAAHRFSTIKCADKIIVLQKGKICGSGIHEELFNNNEIYRTLLLNQIND